MSSIEHASDLGVNLHIFIDTFGARSILLGTYVKIDLNKIQFFQFHNQFDTISFRKSSRSRFFLNFFELILKGFDFAPIDHFFLKYSKIIFIIFGRFGEEII